MRYKKNDPLEELYGYEAAELYDTINLMGQPLTAKMNEIIGKHLTEYNALRILDMLCGTGAQCISLNLAGFDVVASDISSSMIKHAQNKASMHNIDMPFQVADMRTVSVGKFQGIISLYHAIGHLSKDDFATTLKNASENLEAGGTFVFDTFNEKAMPTHEFVDVNFTFNDKAIKRKTRMNFDREQSRCQFLHQTTIQESGKEIRTLDEDFSLTFYTVKELIALVKENGFSSIDVYDKSMIDLVSIRDSMSLIVARI